MGNAKFLETLLRFIGPLVAKYSGLAHLSVGKDSGFTNPLIEDRYGARTFILCCGDNRNEKMESQKD